MRLLYIALLPIYSLCLGFSGAPTPQPSAAPLATAATAATLTPFMEVAEPKATHLPAPLPATMPLPNPPPSLPEGSHNSTISNDPRETLWRVEEGLRRGPEPLITTWTAEKSEKDTRITQIRAGASRSVTAEATLETAIRDRIARISVRLPTKLQQTEKSKCERWLEFETLYGRRYFCEGEDTTEVFDIAANLRKLFPENRTPSSTRSSGGSAGRQ